jgi:hypothetical protein
MDDFLGMSDVHVYFLSEVIESVVDKILEEAQVYENHFIRLFEELFF